MIKYTNLGIAGYITAGYGLAPKISTTAPATLTKFSVHLVEGLPTLRVFDDT